MSSRYSSRGKTIDTGAKAGSLAAGRAAAQAALAASMGQKIAPTVGSGKTPPPKKAPVDVKVDKKAKNAAANALASKLNFGARAPPPPPPSSSGSGGSSSGISEADKARAQPYLKMMKMKMPEGAVRHKMTSDGIPNHVQDFVINDGGSSSSAPSSSSGGGGGGGISDADKARAQPYLKMVKMKMPEGAVRHKMTSDGIPNHIQDFVMSGGESSGNGSGGDGGGGISDADKARAQPYLKMIKMKMPEGAVRHKMTNDGIPSHIQDFVMSGGVDNSASSGGSSSSAATAAPKKKAGNYSSLSASEEKIATKYRKMHKMGLPEGAIMQKMAVEGVAENIQKSVLAGEIPDPDAPKYSTLSPEDEGIATQYRKMLKMGLPEGAVVQRMKINGVSDEIVKSVLAREVPDPNAGAVAASPMAGVFGAIAGGDPSALLKKTDGPQASQGGGSSEASSSNPASAIAAAAAAASRRRTLTGDELAREIEKNKQSHATSASPMSPQASIAAAAVAAASKRGGGDNIAAQIESRRKERTKSNAGVSLPVFAGKLKKSAPRRNQSDFGAITGHGPPQGLKIPSTLNPPRPRDRTKGPPVTQNRSKSDYTSDVPPVGPNGLPKRNRPGPFWKKKDKTQQQQPDSSSSQPPVGPNGLPRRTRSGDNVISPSNGSSASATTPFGQSSLKKVGTPGRAASDFSASSQHSTTSSNFSTSLRSTKSNTTESAAAAAAATTTREKPSPAGSSRFGQSFLKKSKPKQSEETNDSDTKTTTPAKKQQAPSSRKLKVSSVFSGGKSKGASKDKSSEEPEVSNAATPSSHKLGVSSAFAGGNSKSAYQEPTATDTSTDNEPEASKPAPSSRKLKVASMFSGKSKPTPEVDSAPDEYKSASPPTSKEPVEAAVAVGADAPEKPRPEPNKGKKLAISSMFSGKSKPSLEAAVSTPNDSDKISESKQESGGDDDDASSSTQNIEPETPTGRKMGISSIFSGKSKPPPVEEESSPAEDKIQMQHADESGDSADGGEDSSPQETAEPKTPKGRKMGLSSMFAGKSKPARVEAESAPTESKKVSEESLVDDDNDAAVEVPQPEKTEEPKGQQMELSSMLSSKSISTPNSAMTCEEHSREEISPIVLSTSTASAPIQASGSAVSLEKTPASIPVAAVAAASVSAPKEDKNAQSDVDDAIDTTKPSLRTVSKDDAASADSASADSSPNPGAADRRPSPARKGGPVPAIFRSNNRKPKPVPAIFRNNEKSKTTASATRSAVVEPKSGPVPVPVPAAPAPASAPSQEEKQTEAPKVDIGKEGPSSESPEMSITAAAAASTSTPDLSLEATCEKDMRAAAAPMVPVKVPHDSPNTVPSEKKPLAGTAAPIPRRDESKKLPPVPSMFASYDPKPKQVPSSAISEPVRANPTVSAKSMVAPAQGMNASISSNKAPSPVASRKITEKPAQKLPRENLQNASTTRSAAATTKPVQAKTTTSAPKQQEAPMNSAQKQKENIVNNEEAAPPTTQSKQKKKRVRKDKKSKGGKVRDDGTEQHCIVM